MKNKSLNKTMKKTEALLNRADAMLKKPVEQFNPRQSQIYLNVQLALHLMKAKS
jgi:hypothetical protein